MMRRLFSWASTRLRGSVSKSKRFRENRGHSYLLEELESRTLFSADSLVGLIGSDASSDLQSTPAEYIDVTSLESSSPGASQAEYSLPTSKESLGIPELEVTKELVFVDTGVEGYEQLLADLLEQGSESRQFVVYTLDSQSDGIAQISAILAEQTEVDAVHVVSHGSEGSINLGNSRLNSASLDNYSDAIAGWSTAFTADADILIYGCDLAGNSAGQSLTNALSQITGADVAASDDDTGQASLGGDWELEYRVGQIETSIAFSANVQQNWRGLLAYETYRDEFITIDFAGSDGSKDWTASPWQEIGESNGAVAGQVRVGNILAEQGLQIRQNANGAMRQVDLSAASTATLSFDYARIGFNDVNDFVALEISANGGGSWTELSRFSGVADDASLLQVNYDISGFTASDTQVRFVSNLSSSSDRFFVDNFQVAYASALTPGTEFRVNQVPTDFQQTSAENRGSQQAVSLAADGSYVVTWSGTNPLFGSGVFARRFDASGSPLTGDILVNQHIIDDQQWARVASDAAGNFVVTWTSSNQGSTPQSVYARRFDANGTALTNEFQVNATVSGIQKDSVIAMDQATGDFVIAWQGEGSGDTAGIFFRRFNADGTAKDTIDQLANLTDRGTENDPAIAMQASGNFVIVWEEAKHLYFQRFDSTGNPITGGPQNGEVQIDGPFSTSSGASVGSDAAGNFTVVYREESTLTGIWHRGFNADGTEKYTWSHLATGDAISPSIDMADDGSHIITYQKTGTGLDLDVFAEKFDANGNSLGAAFQVNQTSAGSQSQASIALIDTDHYVVAWTHDDTTQTDVYARQFGTANTIPTTTGISAVTVNEDAADTVINLFAAFADAEDSDANLTYSVQSNTNMALFASTAIDGVAGTLTLNYAPDRNGSANLTVRATDMGGLFVDTTFTVTVNAVNDAPTDINLSNSTIPENMDTSGGSNIGLLTSVDPDAGDSATYSIVGGADQAKFTIGGTNSDELILSDGLLDHENQAVYDVRVAIQDSGGLIYQKNLNINVSDLNDLPVITSSNLPNVDENTNTVINVIATDQDVPAQNLSYAISGGLDAGLFSVDSNSGLLVFDFAPDFENPSDFDNDNLYKVDVTVDDGNGGLATQSLVVKVVDVNETPQLSGGLLSLNKFSSNGTLVGNPKAVD